MHLVDKTSLSAGNVQRVVPCEIYVRSRYFFIPNATSSWPIYPNFTSKRPLMIARNKRIGLGIKFCDTSKTKCIEINFWKCPNTCGGVRTLETFEASRRDHEKCDLFKSKKTRARFRLWRNKANDIEAKYWTNKQDVYSRRGQMDSPLLKMLPFARPCDSIYLNLPAKLASSGIAASSDAATSFRNQFPREIEYRRNGALSGQIDHCRPSGTTWPLLGNARSNIFLFIIHLWRGPSLDDL